MTEFGIRLKQAMDKEGTTASELSRITGISKSLISYYLSGKCLAKQDKVYVISKALNVDPGWLITGVEPSENETRQVPIIIPNNETFVKIVQHMSVEDYRTVMAIFEKTNKKMQEEGII